MKRTTEVIRAAAWLLIGAICLGAGVAHAQADAAHYLALCRRHGVVSGKDAATASTEYEIRGEIAGIAESSDSYNLLVKLNSGSTLTLGGTGKAPEFSVGSRIRGLVGASASGGGLPLLGSALEADVAELQEEARTNAARAEANRAPAYRFRRGRRAAPMSSRSFSGVRPVMPVSAGATLDAYKRAIRYFNPRGSEAEIETIATAVLNDSIRYQVDARLVMAVFAVESSFKSGATSRTGAMGIGQLMPGTAASLGVRNAYDPMQNIEGAVRYIREQLDAYQGKDEWTRLQLVLASYNAGPNAVKKFGGIPPYRETQAYVRHVSSWYLRFLGVDR